MPFEAVPQRYSPSGYIDCEPHRATTYAVYRTYPKRPRRFISRHSTLATARAEVEFHTRNNAKLSTRPKKVIARSLSQTQYLLLHPRPEL